ncbi:MAG: hypothetical protein J7L53_08935 [Deltaproteobacteria bacterium]|nr:hypothetical protein [Deltaproteobacteria bacterium]
MGLKWVAMLEIISGIGVILFWVGFFTIGLAPASPPECYFAYEHAFPLPDIIMSIVLIVAGVQLLKANIYGLLLSLAGAGAFVFLGLLDFSFNYQNGIYFLGGADLYLNAFINLWCVVFGIFVIIRIIQTSKRLMEGSNGIQG